MDSEDLTGKKMFVILWLNLLIMFDEGFWPLCNPWKHLLNDFLKKKILKKTPEKQFMYLF